ELMKPSLFAAAFDRSITRPLMKGPRSLTRTTTDLPFSWLVTLSLVPKGRVRCAAVSSDGSICSPEAVWEYSAYQEALPHCAEAGTADAAARNAPASAPAMAAADLFIIPKV